MNNQYNIAVVLLRFSGIIFIFFGMLGLIYIGLFLFILLQGARDWFSQSVAPSALQSILTSPL
jgi:sugar phosphate permease